ncbi:hypothetical protein NE237_001257 [Protea cynaroides]|uniref:Nudix hydrolase domain-containing protein n=1 Tax=Protea cynaroides TaxID=273540 RepID=A0A9Q0KSZ4_9MAGN|nr:hypothetical protein NE237_001257 [Protea cynaroides]
MREDEVLLLEEGSEGSVIQRIWVESKKIWQIAGLAIFSRVALYAMTLIIQAFAGHLGNLDLAAISIASIIAPLIHLDLGLLNLMKRRICLVRYGKRVGEEFLFIMSRILAGFDIDTVMGSAVADTNSSSPRVLCDQSSKFKVQSLKVICALNRRSVPKKGLKIKSVDPLTVRYMSHSVSSSSAMENVVSENAAQPVELLHGVEDDFGGVIVDMKDPLDSDVFVATLRASISQWRQEGKKGVWIKLPIELVNLVEPAVKEGFGYHHAEPKYLMLVYWIPESPNTIPANASHRVGVGACVINDKREMLVVQEKSGKFQASGIWKFPTGAVDEGENIREAAIREVKEETGIDAEFVEVLAFRQSHQSFFGKSDLLFICMLRPLSFDIQKQEAEIEAAQWMPIEDYEAQPFVQEHQLAKSFADVFIAKINKRYAGFSPVRTRTGFSGKPVDLYFNNCDLNKPSASI